MTQLVVGGGDRVLVAMIHLTDNTLMISLYLLGYCSEFCGSSAW